MKLLRLAAENKMVIIPFDPFFLQINFSRILLVSCWSTDQIPHVFTHWKEKSQTGIITVRLSFQREPLLSSIVFALSENPDGRLMVALWMCLANVRILALLSKYSLGMEAMVDGRANQAKV